MFEVQVNPEMIYQRVRRSTSGTNVPPDTSKQNHAENPEIKEIKPQKPTKSRTMRGGKREAAGRPRKIDRGSDVMGFAQMAIIQLELIVGALTFEMTKIGNCFQSVSYQFSILQGRFPKWRNQKSTGRLSESFTTKG